MEVFKMKTQKKQVVSTKTATRKTDKTKRADAVKTATDKNAEIITAKNVKHIGEMFAVRALKTILDKCAGTAKNDETQAEKNKHAKLQGGIYQFINEMNRNLINDINNISPKTETANEKTKWINNDFAVSDSYDIAQTAIMFLCGYIGKRLDDKAENGTDKNGNAITIKTACFRAVNRYIMQNRTKTYKTAYIDDLQGNDIAIPFEWDLPTIADYNGVIKTIREMNLTERQDKILSYRLRGKSISEISRKLSVSRQAIIKTIGQIKTKYKAL